MARGYQIFPRSKDYRDNFDRIFGEKNSPADGGQADCPFCRAKNEMQWRSVSRIWQCYVCNRSVLWPPPELSESELGSNSPDDPPDKGK